MLTAKMRQAPFLRQGRYRSLFASGAGETLNRAEQCFQAYGTRYSKS